MCSIDDRTIFIEQTCGAKALEHSKNISKYSVNKIGSLKELFYLERERKVQMNRFSFRLSSLLDRTRESEYSLMQCFTKINYKLLWLREASSVGDHSGNSLV